MDYKATIKNITDNDVSLQDHLFVKGFLITEVPQELGLYPFYSNWKYEKHGRFYFYTKNNVGAFFKKMDYDTLFLIGHAYNPFTMEHDENKILDKIATEFAKGENAFYDAIDELTGIFVFGYFDNDKLNIITDASGIQSACIGVEKGKMYASSHSQLIGDILNLEMDKFVNELINYKWYGRVMGPYLPADLTPFINFKRIVPNIMFTYKSGAVSTKRFYPREPIHPCKTEPQYNNVIKKASDILKNNMELITKKWDRPQISLTGGIDSNTTFAAANGIYDKYETFSYLSAEKEVPDVDAAKKIAEAFNIKHTVYDVPQTTEKIEKYDEIVKILLHNNAHCANTPENELRKRCILQKECTADVEVKSWVSETIRGYWYKHYGRSKMPKRSPKLYRNLYKIFIANRPLAHKVDKLFKEYLEKYEYDKIPAIYPPADIHFWEVTWGSWGSVNISEMKYCFDITIAYNNRRFLEELFKLPIEDRISDKHHLEMKKYLNKDLYDMNIRVVNMKETDTRARLLNVIFTLNSKLPF